MPEYLAPAVFVEETSFRAKSIEGVGTTTTAFVGTFTDTPTFAALLSSAFLGELPDHFLSEFASLHLGAFRISCRLPTDVHHEPDVGCPVVDRCNG